jgi:hypothetical protein
VVAVSTHSMGVTGRGGEAPITSFAFDPGGEVLYALGASRMLAIDPRGPRVLRSVALPASAGFGAIVRVA